VTLSSFRSAWAGSVALLMVIISGCGGGGGAFHIYPLWVPTDVVVTDVDGDGRMDVMTLAMLSESEGHREGRLTVYRQTSPGVFAAPDNYSVGRYPWRLAVADLDGDGRIDVIASDTERQDIGLLRQDPQNSGRFLPEQRIEVGGTSYEAAVADLNGDGLPDIAVGDASAQANRAVLLYQDPTQRGSFLTPTSFPLPGAAGYVAVGDLNRDGRADLAFWLVLSEHDYVPSGAHAISFQQPSGTLSSLTSFAPQTGLNVDLLSVVDQDGDGANDLVVFYSPTSQSYRAKLTVILQSSTPGTFASPVDTSLANYSGLDGATVADLNGDSAPDVAFAGFWPTGSDQLSPSDVHSQVKVFLQAGRTFAVAGAYNLPFSCSRVGAGDLDADGLNDLVALGDDNQSLVLMQIPSLPGTFSAPHALH
jgi:hypothetical protein